jgi:DNA-binding MarR family transcriptional regulator
MDPIRHIDNDEAQPDVAELISAARHFHRQLRARLIEVLDFVDLTYPQFEVLEIIERDPNHHAGSLAGHLGVTRQAAHRIATRMEVAGLVHFLGFDGGVRGIHITEHGLQRLEEARGELDGFHRFVGDRLVPRTRRALLDAVRAAEAAIKPPPRW